MSGAVIVLATPLVIGLILLALFSAKKDRFHNDNKLGKC